MPLVECAHPLDLGAALHLGGSGEFLLAGLVGAAFGEEGVDADEGQRPVVLASFVVHRLVLDPSALIAGLHRPEDSAAVGDAVELVEDRALD